MIANKTFGYNFLSYFCGTYFSIVKSSGWTDDKKSENHSFWLFSNTVGKDFYHPEWKLVWNFLDNRALTNGFPPSLVLVFRWTMPGANSWMCQKSCSLYPVKIFFSFLDSTLKVGKSINSVSILPQLYPSLLLIMHEEDERWYQLPMLTSMDKLIGLNSLP